MSRVPSYHKSCKYVKVRYLFLACVNAHAD